jgi:hypothetical protein
MEENNVELAEEKKRILGKKEHKILIFNIAVLVVFIIIGILIVGFQGFPEKKKEDDTVDFSGVAKICELSTLRCYYHNVAELEKQPDGLFQRGWFHFGYKKLWLEYTGTIEVGIDVDQVQVNDPDENNIVHVYVPDARITTVSADADSMSDPITDTGKFTEITVDDKTNAFTEAQKDMQAEAEADTSILNRAKNNAKKLIEQYIINVGEQIGETYTVEWLDEPQNTEGVVTE